MKTTPTTAAAIKTLRRQIRTRRTWDPMGTAALDALVQGNLGAGMAELDALRAAITEHGLTPMA